jgi:hypothetical protein
MKKLTIILMTLCLFSCCNLLAQDKIDRYCVITAYYSAFSNTAPLKKILVDCAQSGTISSFSDSSMIKKLDTVTQCKTEAEILNYMTSIGWILVNNLHPQGVIYLLFRRPFPISDITTGKP